MNLPIAVITGPRGAKTVTLDGHVIPAVRTIEVIADAHDVEVLRLAILCERVEWRDAEATSPWTQDDIKATVRERLRRERPDWTLTEAIREGGTLYVRAVRHEDPGTKAIGRGGDLDSAYVDLLAAIGHA